MKIVEYYRTLSPELRVFLTLANKEVGLGQTLELLAEKAGFPSKLRRHERLALRQLAAARGFNLEI